MNSEMTVRLAAIAVNAGVLTILSFQDIKRKRVNWILMAILAVFNGVFGFILDRSLLQIAAGIAPGVFGLLISFGTKGKLGAGDGLCLIALGVFYDWEKVLMLWLAALLICALTGMVLMILKRANLKTALPFIPFLTIGYAALQITESVLHV